MPSELPELFLRVPGGGTDALGTWQALGQELLRAGSQLLSSTTYTELHRA